MSRTATAPPLAGSRDDYFSQRATHASARVASDCEVRHTALALRSAACRRNRAVSSSPLRANRRFKEGTRVAPVVPAVLAA